ncbi:ABC transporter substrate-binding protein [Microbacterium amylolyticum]|uniref:Cellobiose transport system substrate-binding protein n=1 Tax=Microbacterium amylolyticum TaxID=936337 RepID=A0ABS4ZIX8_9MICO|nr:ABC transporter substrate-binding protein [Microbacterium amylolyticum]MBP2436441.1 cellobiose transport system substrate-binding protein [Microbacterium amylolyticum]
MSTPANRRAAGGIAVVAAGALALAGCGASDADTDANTGDGSAPTELSISTFNDFGYTEELLAMYEEETGIRVIHNRAATSNDARYNLFQKLGSSGLSDIEGVEVDWFAELMEYSDLLAPVPAGVEGRWLDWKEAAATDADGNLVAYGTDIGPQGICFRADLFEAAGLPSDRDEVAELFPTWDAFFDVADDYVEATGQPFIDASNSVLQGMVNQLTEIYETPDGEIIADSNSAVREAYDTVIERALPVSAYAGQWSDDWYASMSSGEFATMLCPPWMHGIIAGEAPNVDGWDVASAYPGGGSNWGGSYLVVPANGDNVEAAQALADWLTSPETQVKAFENAGAFPSQPAAYESESLTGYVSEYFNDAPTGQIGIDRAESVSVEPFKGPKFFPIHDALNQAVTRVFDGLESPDDSWNTWLNEVASL